MQETDILIAGGGIAGLSAAARLAADGWRIVLADPAPARIDGTGDLRTTAFLQPAIATLTRGKAWPAMQTGAAPLRVMRLVDAGGIERKPREIADFEGPEAGHEVFGWNVSNTLARTALLDALSAEPRVSLRHEASISGMTSRSDGTILRLSDGSQIWARLAIAADGRDSTLARLAGIRQRRWDYGQKALVFCVTHRRPHEGISTEIHRTGGPLALVPMPDIDANPASSVVWLVPGPRAEMLSRLDDEALSSELGEATMDLFGDFRVASPRAVWPIISQLAQRLTGPRLALIAEAAHVMPPIGAQGLNTSLDDIEALASMICGQPDPGERRLLDRYQARQWPRTMAKVAGIDLLNRAARTESQPLRDLRRFGLSAISRIGPLRQLAIRAGMGG